MKALNKKGLEMSILRKISLFIILLGLLCSSSLTAYAADPPLPTPVGRVVWVKGELRAIMPNNEERILQKSSVIYLSDVLTTNATSQAQIIFTDESLMTFYPNTKFIIKKYSFTKTKKGSVGSYFMDLVEGGFRTITGLIAKSNPNEYQVNTPVATIGVRGTDYAVYIQKDQLYIGYYTGKPCVTNKKNAELCLDEKTRYASVNPQDAAPVPLSQQPIVFKEKLEVLPATISQFNTALQPRSSGGAVTSFCISQ